MSDDWDGSSSEAEDEQQPQQQQQGKAKSAPTAQTTGSTASQKVKKPPAGGKKWEGEDEEADDTPVSDWEESSSEEEKDAKPPTAVPITPPKKKGTLKQKLAEKEAAAKAAKANGKDAHSDDDDESDDEYDSDAVLDPREKARRDKEREVKADLKNAADLLGSAALGAHSSSDITALLSFQPRTKEDFIKLSDQFINLLVKPHQSKPLYPFFAEHHARALALSLKDVEVRKVASGLTTLANEKQKEQRDKASGKKKVKPKTAMKPGLGPAKVSSKLDTSVYDEALDDFGTNPDDFM